MLHPLTWVRLLVLPQANYDLKRDVHKKLEKLERRTQVSRPLSSCC